MITLISNDPADHLALRFVVLVRRCTTAFEYAEILKRNKTIPDGCCATHDFFDANMVMLEAFNAHAKREMDLESEADCRLWSRAWKIATTEYLTEKDWHENHPRLRCRPA